MRISTWNHDSSFDTRPMLRLEGHQIGKNNPTFTKQKGKKINADSHTLVKVRGSLDMSRILSGRNTTSKNTETKRFYFRKEFSK